MARRPRMAPRIGTGKQTDNKKLGPKIELRMHFLDRYHKGGATANVFDACQGDGTIWNAIRERTPVASYWGVDLKPAPGRLKVDSIMVLAQPGLAADVVDIDTHGLPWKHWRALLPNVKLPMTVFLTVGGVKALGQQYAVGGDVLESLGIAPKIRIPRGFPCSRLRQMAIPYLIHEAIGHGLDIVEAKIVVDLEGSAWYLGVRLEPNKT